MMDRVFLWSGGACLLASAIPFWLWKLYIIRGPLVHNLVWTFVALFGLGEVLGLILGCRLSFRTAQNWAVRGVLVVGLLGCVAYVTLMAALGMNFVGQ